MNELGFYQNESDFETAVVGLYSGLQSYGQNLIWMNELATDNAVFQLANAETAVTGFDYMNLSATNAYVTPHVAWATIEARKKLVEMLGNNIRAFLDGHPVNVVS